MGQYGYDRDGKRGKLTRLIQKVEQRNPQLTTSRRCQPEGGQLRLQIWADRHELTALVKLRLEDQVLVMERSSALRDELCRIVPAH